jgi:chemotaxis protein CheY-P-specific phosphatase CheC
MSKWEGETDNEKWTLIVETDCFSCGEPHVVVLDTEQDSEERGSVLLLLTPEQAREVANTLLREATAAELQTERSRRYRQEHEQEG